MFQKEIGINYYDKLQKVANDIQDIKTEEYDSFKKEKYRNIEKIWRYKNEECKIPDKISLKLDSGNLGCFKVTFSTFGKFVACGCYENNNIGILKIFNVFKGSLKREINAHFGLIYDLQWSKDDEYIISASADGSCKL